MRNYQASIPIILGLLYLTSGSKVPAQLIPDTTLGTENSVVTPVDTLNKRIDGGASRGINLFHSFLQFNIGNNNGVYFANPIGIENILTRVTGSNTSNILGTLGVLGNANLFLINPNGIYFGVDAKLDVSGSFLATTADGIQLGSAGYFSAAEPQSSQLLSIQPEALFSNALRNDRGSIKNSGNLTVGGDFTLNSDNLNLQGQLQAGGNLTLQATDTIQMRDNATTPFIASAGGNLLVEGNRAIDIFALNHPNSGLFSGGEMVFRSANTVRGDAHYYSGGNFRIEQLNGNMGNLYSPDDPVIRSLGDVSFNSYEGASLHILAAGKVEIPGEIVIDSPDPINGLVETVTLSNRDIILIDGQNNLTVDIRAGMEAAAVGISSISGNGMFFDSQNNPLPATGTISATATSADIKIGSIITESVGGDVGRVFISNQYQPNSALTGSITVDNIDTRDDLGGGGIAIDSRSNINITGAIEASALDFSLGNGGAVLLLARDNITLSPGASINTDGNLGGLIILNSGGDILLQDNTLFSDSFNPVPAATDLIGGNIEFRAQNLRVNDTIISSSTDGFANAGNISITVADAVQFQNSQVTAIATENAVGNAGFILIDADNVQLLAGSLLDTAVFGRGDGGVVDITARDAITVENSSIFSTIEPGAVGEAGGILVNAGNVRLLEGSLLNTNTFGQGNAGIVDINATETIVVDNSRVLSNVELGAEGDAVGILVRARDVEIKNGGDLSSSSRGLGNAGVVSIAADGMVSIDGNTSVVANTLFETGVGEAGAAIIEANNLRLTNGGKIDTSTLGLGNAGQIIIQVRESVVLDDSGFFSTVQSEAVGNAGGILVEAHNIQLLNGGRFETSTLGQGDAGIVIATVGDTLQVSGVGSDRVPSLISSTVRRGAVGNGGDIGISAESVRLADNAQITTNNFTNTGVAGDISITTRQNLEGDRATISASTNSGDGGNLTFEVGGILLLRNNSSISTSAGTVGTGGNGGNINVTALFVVGVPWENSDITANAFEGNGGDIAIATNQIYGLEFRAQQTAFSDITASSQFGLSGNFDLELLSFPAEQGLNSLPESPVDAESLVGRDACAEKEGRIAGGSSLIVTGRGGLPVDAAEGLPSLGGIVEWATREGEGVEAMAGNLREETDESQSPQSLRPARGWRVAADGTVILTAQATTTDVPASNLLRGPHCRVFSETKSVN